MLLNKDWDHICEAGDIKYTSWHRWEETFTAVMKQCIPTAMIKINSNPSWLNKTIKSKIRKRNILTVKLKGMGTLLMKYSIEQF